MTLRPITAAAAVAVLMLWAAPASAQVDLVATVKADVIQQHINIDGPCGAFEITRRVALAVKAGLLGGKTPGQNGCSMAGDRYSVDFIMWPDGRVVDILTDAGGANTPAWFEESVDPQFYRVALPIAVPTPIPTPAPPEPAPPVDLTPILQELSRVHEHLVTLGNQVQQLLDKPDPPPPTLPSITFPAYTGRVLGFGVTLRPVQP